MKHEFKNGDNCPFCEGKLTQQGIEFKCSNHCYFDNVKWEKSKGRSTSFTDKNGDMIHEGDKIYGKTADGDEATFNVKWSDYRNTFIGDNPDEIYDISPSIFHQYEIVV
jgi:hypothetical protein